MTDIDLEKYGKEFDRLVSEFNSWLKSLEDPKILRKRNFKAFLRGMGSVLNISGVMDPLEFRSSNPIYSNKDLYPEQKDAILLASDLNRVKKSLCNIVCGKETNPKVSIEDARMGKVMIEGMYNDFKNIYVSNEIKKNFNK